MSLSSSAFFLWWRGSFRCIQIEPNGEVHGTQQKLINMFNHFSSFLSSNPCYQAEFKISEELAYCALPKGLQLLRESSLQLQMSAGHAFRELFN